MSKPDFEQTAFDHCTLLILLRGVGTAKPPALQKIFENVGSVKSIVVQDSARMERNIWIRFVSDYPVENNDWGDFQTHRKLLGIVTVGKFDTQAELNELCRQHESLKVRYNSTLCDSRSLILGPLDSFTIDEKSASSDPCTENRKIFNFPSYFKTKAIICAESDEDLTLKAQIIEFLNNIFWIVESKRLERSREKLEKPCLLHTPFEKKDLVGLDMETRNYRKRCTGRKLKNLADLCLQTGLLKESIALYNNALETLKSVNDFLWLGAAEEGLSAASICYLYTHNNGNEESQEKHLKNEATQTSSMVILPEAVSYVLSSDDIFGTYRKAIINYSKYSHAAVIEAEAALKAARICVKQNKPLEVAMFLQNIILIEHTFGEPDRVKQFQVITNLYSLLGYQRKTGFFQRLTALKHVQQGNLCPNWGQAYNLMLKSFAGYLLNLDPLEMSDEFSGWPALQIDLLQSVITAARRLGHLNLSTRHMTYLLQTHWENLSEKEQTDMSIQLQNLSAQCEGSPVPLLLDDGTLIPPANLTNLPMCLDFVIKNIEGHLHPQNIKKTENDCGPFLFTPIHLNSISKNTKTKYTECLWVQNDLSKIILTLYNPLPFELTVSDIRLLTDGVVFESTPQSVTLKPLSNQQFDLCGTPLEVGALNITGYSTHTLGVKSNCYLNELKAKHFPPKYKVNVIPSLPKIFVSTTLANSTSVVDHSVDKNVFCSAKSTIYSGQLSSFVVKIVNESSIPVEFLEIEFNSNADDAITKKILTFDETKLQSKLPVNPGSFIEFDIQLFGESDFIRICPVSTDYSKTESEKELLSTKSVSLIESHKSNLNLEQSCGQCAKLVLFKFLIKYSGGSALKEGYCRIGTMLLDVEIQPSSQIVKCDILSAEVPHQFYLVLDIVNSTKHEMLLNYTDNKNILMETEDSCRVPIPVNRFSAESIWNSGKFHQNSLLQENKVISDACLNHIAESVKLKWTLIGTDISGIISLQGLALSLDMIDQCMSPRLELNIEFFNKNVFTQLEIVCPVGKKIDMKIWATNKTEEVLEKFLLFINIYQDFLNGVKYHNVETRVATSGPNRILIPQMAKYAKVLQNYSIIFFSPGRYKIDVRYQRCSDLQIQQSQISTHSSQLMGKKLDQQNEDKLWKHTSTFEVTVVETNE